MLDAASELLAQGGVHSLTTRGLAEYTGIPVGKGAPDFAAELLVRLFDRVFEFVFSQRRTAQEQEAIVREFVEMVATHMERYATPTGVRGVNLSDFLPALQRESGRGGHSQHHD